jgi:hypothetical protein
MIEALTIGLSVYAVAVTVFIFWRAGKADYWHGLSDTMAQQRDDAADECAQWRDSAREEAAAHKATQSNRDQWVQAAHTAQGAHAATLDILAVHEAREAKRQAQRVNAARLGGKATADKTRKVAVIEPEYVTIAREKRDAMSPCTAQV